MDHNPYFQIGALKQAAKMAADVIERGLPRVRALDAITAEALADEMHRLRNAIDTAERNEAKRHAV